MSDITKIDRIELQKFLGVRKQYRITVHRGWTLRNYFIAGDYLKLAFLEAAQQHLVNEWVYTNSWGDDIPLETIRLNKIIDTQHAVSKLEDMGLRPADAAELLSFGIHDREAQYESQIVALCEHRGNEKWPEGGFYPMLYGRKEFKERRFQAVRPWVGVRYWPAEVRLAAVPLNYKPSTPIPSRMCDEGCGNIALWVRDTQFAGSHYFCEWHAKQESDFGKADPSYFTWERILA
jgi:hypothetical protein